jgi:hypothetical protein
MEEIQHHDAVLAAGESHQYAIAILDQAIAVYRLSDQPSYLPL